MLPYNQLPKDYTIEEAKKDGCVVYEDLDITSGQTAWDEFIKDVEDGKNSIVRIAFYYTLGDPLQYSKEYYSKIKDDYPIFNIMELSYDGEKYTLLRTEEEKDYTDEYRYLVKYTGKPSSVSATYSEFTYYVLINDNTLTWKDIENGMLSSQSDALIDHHIVYSDLTYK
jgi:hypothetical protein